MTPEEKTIVRNLVNRNLDAAEQRWKQIGRLLKKETASLEEAARKGTLVPTKFPGMPIVDSEIPVVQRFAAFVADMRGSTSHLRDSAGLESGIQRLYYETSGLLPALAKIVENHGGAVTEYTGDGILGFYSVGESATSGELLGVVDAGDECVNITSEIVNPILRQRYDLPPISIGVGIALGPVLLSVIGIANDLRPLGFGEAVFLASKLSKEENKVVVHDSIDKAWPVSEGGKISFKPISVRGTWGYTVSRG
jgi:class 3 adenylate cyclase